MKRKRKSALPRVTLLAYSRKDLLAFVEAVEALRHIAADLALVVKELRATPNRRKAAPAVTPVDPGASQWGVAVPPGPSGKGGQKP